MEKTLQELADLLQGSIIQGDPLQESLQVVRRLTEATALRKQALRKFPLPYRPIWNWPVRAGPAPS